MSYSSENIPSRYPLKDSSNYGNFLELTPSKSKNQFDSTLPIIQNTPPENMSELKKSKTTFSTPIKYVDFDNVSIIESNSNGLIKSTYLSPAFSSPTQKIDNSCINDDHDEISISKPIQSSPIKKSLKKSKSKESLKKSSSSNTSSSSSSSTYSSSSSVSSSNVSFDLLSEEKPPYSYATLIGISILSHPAKKLTLSHIYQWISDTFKYYKKGDVGWQNSIRHNLSLNKAFIKGEKSKDGKGHFWSIKQGSEEQFLKSRSVKKGSYQKVIDQITQAARLNASSTTSNLDSLNSNDGVSKSKIITFDNDNNNDKENLSNKNTSVNLPSSPTYPTLKRKLNHDNDISNESDDDDDDDDDGIYDGNEDITIIDPPMKKFKSEKTNKLGDPWQSSSLTESINNNNNITADRPSVNILTTTPKTSSTPRFIIDSPNKPMLAGKNLTYTSSFSCMSNFELSPARPIETGPLLEPLTPANNISRHIQSQQSHLVIKSRTPKSSSTSTSSIIKTPIRNIRTPQTNSMIKKLWNSPSYLDDFYYSPLINNSLNFLLAPSSSSSSSSQSQSQSKLSTVTASFSSYDDDDMISRNFNHPHVQSSPILGSSRDQFLEKENDNISSCKNLLEDLKNVGKREEPN